MKRDCITGIVGLMMSAFFLFVTLTGIRRVPNLVEPGPLMMPYIALGIIALCSLALLVRGLKDKTPEKPYFPKGGIKKITLILLQSKKKWKTYQLPPMPRTFRQGGFFF